MCRAVREAEARSLRWFLLESYYSASLLRELEKRRFCVRHAERLLNGGDHPQLTGTFEYLAQVERHLMQDIVAMLRQGSRVPPALRRSGRSLPRRGPAPGDRAHCPACAAGAVAAATTVGEIVRTLATEGGREAYGAHEGLCRPHTWDVLREAPEDVAIWLAEETDRRMERLLEECRLYFHRLDYRFAHEPKGAEQTAWRRGLRFFWSDVAPTRGGDGAARFGSGDETGAGEEA